MQQLTELATLYKAGVFTYQLSTDQIFYLSVTQDKRTELVASYQGRAGCCQQPLGSFSLIPETVAITIRIEEG